VGLAVENLRLKDFRSYQQLEISPDPCLTVLVGPNAAGKTNVIEALQLLTAAESFRRPQWSEVVRWGREQSDISLTAAGDDRHLLTELVVSAAGRREYRINGKLRRRISEVVGVLPSVVFTPDDLRIVKDSAERRRTTLDALGVQLSPSYLRIKTDYERVLRQRNAALREPEPNEGQLGVLNEQLVSTGVRLHESRTRLFERMKQSMVAAHQGVAPDSELSLSYLSSWERNGAEPSTQDSETALRTQLGARRAEERARRVSLVGPHRDDILFAIDSRDARVFASQGQQRTIALSWKLAEVLVVTDVAGQPPLLLLDDVMSELDAERRHALTRFVGTAAQTVVTTTNLDYFDEELLDRGTVVRLGE
jgi:DNA replication and repair protein RecF